MNNKKIGIIMIAIAAVIALFGAWLKTYNDKIAQVQYNQTGSCYLPDGTCLHATSDSILYSSFGIAIIIIIIGVYLLLRKNEKKTIIKNIKNVKNNIVTEAPKTLTPEAKIIFDLTAQYGSILQGELVSKSGMDKVRVSRLLDKLEMQGLIERKRHGMSNLVVLKKKS